MQKTFKGMNAKQIEKLIVNGWVTIQGTEYQAIVHDFCPRNNGDVTGTLVLDNVDKRIVLSY